MNIVTELKENNQDFEFYPTTDEMFSVIEPYIDRDTVLDIGCGLCQFKKYMGERISKYFVMEKSKILLNKLPEDAICLGTDFNQNTLMDKRVTTIFCNPPYSEYEEWTKRIISEGNFKQAFLIIPQRWQNNIEIKTLLDKFSTKFSVLGSFDFMNAERSARAKVDVIRFVRETYLNNYRWDKQEDYSTDGFNVWFNETFKVNEENTKSDWTIEAKKEKEKKEKISNALVNAETSKARILVDLYQEEYTTLIDHLQKIMELDPSVLETFGFSVNKVKEGLKTQLTGLKTLYWDMVFNEFEEITSRLTYKTRNKIQNDFEKLSCIDFTLENIYVIILWVIKNANKYYNSQLIKFFEDLSCEENVKPYKSNQRLFEKDGYYWRAEKHNNYVLDYRLIMSSPFRYDDWHDILNQNEYESSRVLNDIKIIAKNLGFNVGDMVLAENFGVKNYIYFENSDKVFMEYKVYKNGNMHVKFNQEFTKAMNVEVSRLLGWIRSAKDIQREFPTNMSKGADKYFKQNYTCIGCNTLMIGVNK